MLTKTALNKLTQAVTSRIREEVTRYNQRLVESVTQEDLFKDYCKVTTGKDIHINATWNVLKEQFPPVFTELLSCLREDRKMDRLECPMNYQLVETVRPEVERLTASLDEYDSDSLLAEQLFEKIYPMLIDAKYIHFESEKHEPVFDLTLPLEEVHDLDSDSEEEVLFDPPYASSGNENSPLEDGSYDEGDWE